MKRGVKWDAGTTTACVSVFRFTTENRVNMNVLRNVTSVPLLTLFPLSCTTHEQFAPCTVHAHHSGSTGVLWSKFSIVELWPQHSDVHSHKENKAWHSKAKEKNERKSHCNTDFKLNLAVTYCFLCEGADMHTGSMAEGIFVFFPTIGVN